jgi:ABC-type glycerol-3-phosphate transport system substrate-binding protein
MWTNFYLNYGGEFLDAKGNILTDGPEAVEATKLYQRLLTKAAPPGVAGFNWMESMASFTQGRSAMWIDAGGWAPPLEDPTASRMVGKVGCTVVPAGPKGQFSLDLWRRHQHCRREPEQGGRVSPVPMGGLAEAGRAAVAGRRRRTVPQFHPQRS